jgi:ABC-type multidrug transport system fused ATPase/permease subunit
MHSTRYQAKSTQSVFIIVSLMMLLIFFIGTSGSAAWSPGSAAAFYFYAYSLTMAFLSLGKAYTSYNSISGATAKIAELIGDDGNNIEVDSGNLIPLKGKIEFRNVDFSYSADKQVLKDVSFSAAEGEWLLITGPSGSGKSTIANLLLGFYKPSSGDVLVDGINIEGINPTELKHSIGFVGQEAVMFEGTIRENILISGKETDEIKLKEILETSMSGDFINRMPAGLDTNIAERGVTLSAGQRARLAIARALVLDPAILVLDEANSMLEESLEKELWENLYKVRKNKTTIIFSHHTEAIPKVYKHFMLQ